MAAIGARGAGHSPFIRISGRCGDSNGRPGKYQQHHGQILDQRRGWLRRYCFQAVSSTWFEMFVMIIIVLNVALGLVEMEKKVSPEVIAKNEPFFQFYFILELASVTFFTVEYAIRFWCCIEASSLRNQQAFGQRLRWMLSPLALLDLFVIGIFWADIAWYKPDHAANHDSGRTSGGGSLRLFRLLRLFSLLRVERNSRSLEYLALIMRQKGQELSVCVFALLTLVVMSATMMFNIEGGAGKISLLNVSDGRILETTHCAEAEAREQVHVCPYLIVLLGSQITRELLTRVRTCAVLHADGQVFAHR